MIVTAEMVNDHLSSPPWSSAQYASVQRRIAKLEADLAAWLQVPLDPEERIETVSVTDSGLVAASAPIYHLLAVDGVIAVNGVPPAGYVRRKPYYLAIDTPETPRSRPFSLLYGDSLGPLSERRVALRYLAGWGDHPLLVGAVIDKAAAYATNRHDDTVTARNLDAAAPPPMEEAWTEQELMLLRSLKVRGIA